MKWLAVVGVVGLVLALAGCPGDRVREICGNGIDDDHNGLTDCADPDCAGHDGCPPFDAGYYGACGRCGASCISQIGCLTADWSSDQPLPQCVDGKCQALNQFVQVKLTLDMSAYAGLDIVRSEATHFVSKTAMDGSAVTCATLSAVATPDAGGLAIEKNNNFTVFGFDSEPVTYQPQLTFPFVSTGTASDYLVWIELWSLARNADAPHEPTGRRFNPLCVESGAQLGPITPADDCRGGAGTCRSFLFTMPAPM
jgi:hypothetical protein